MRFLIGLIFSLIFLKSSACDITKIDVIQYIGERDIPYVDLYIKWGNQKDLFRERDDYYFLELEVEVNIFYQNRKIIVDTFQVNSSGLPVPRDLYSKRVYALTSSGEYTIELIASKGEREVCRIDKSFFSDGDSAKGNVYISDPLLLSSIQRARVDHSGPLIRRGYAIQPLFGWNSRREKELIVYFEAHQTGSSEELFAQITVKNEDGEYLKSLINPLKQNTNGGFFMPIETSDLESGKYILDLSLKTYPKGELILNKRKTFYRENPFVNEPLDSIELYHIQEFTGDLDEEELDYCMRAVVPVVPQNISEEWGRIKKKGTLDEKRKALLSYYVSKDHNRYFNIFMDYMNKIEYANHFYESGFGHGFESDRGVIFLRYGKPNDVLREEHETSAPPYEIWSYNVLEKTGQMNVKFVFYNPSLAPGNFELLHSTANGELSNPRWKLDLYKNAPWDHLSNDINETEVKRNFNRNAARNFQDF